jgi:hypothetical protein
VAVAAVCDPRTLDFDLASRSRTAFAPVRGEVLCDRRAGVAANAVPESSAVEVIAVAASAATERVFTLCFPQL